MENQTPDNNQNSSMQNAGQMNSQNSNQAQYNSQNNNSQSQNNNTSMGENNMNNNNNMGMGNRHNGGMNNMGNQNMGMGRQNSQRGFDRNPYVNNNTMQNAGQMNNQGMNNQSQQNPYYNNNQMLPQQNPSITDSLLGTFDTENFIKGALIGAVGAYLLTNENAQKTIFKTVAKGTEMFQAGMEEMKERFEDAKAEMEAERG